MNLFNQKTRVTCKHLLEEPLHDATNSNTACKIAIVGIGNPLRKEDCIGLDLVEAFFKENPRTTACIVLLDSFTSLLGDIVKNHPTVVIVDAAIFESSQKPYELIPLKNLATPGSFQNFQFMTSHGLSWINEIILQNQSHTCQSKVYLFAVNIKSYEAQPQLLTGSLHQELLLAFEHAIVRLLDENDSREEVCFHA